MVEGKLRKASQIEDGIITNDKLATPATAFAPVPHDVAASRAIDGTVYQNTTGKTMVVVVNVRFDIDLVAGGDATIVANTDTMSPPNLAVAQVGTHTQAGGTLLTQYEALTFVVPDNYYYSITSIVNGANAAVLFFWVEYY